MRLVLLMLLALPALAQAPMLSPEELMGERQIQPPVCVEGKCTMGEDDLQFLVARGKLMEQIATRLYDRLNSCRGGHST